MSLKNIYLAAPGDKLRDKNLVAACGIELVPRPGIELGLSALEEWSLSPWTTSVYTSVYVHAFSLIFTLCYHFPDCWQTQLKITWAYLYQ